MAADFTLQLRCNHVLATSCPAPRSAHSCVLGPDGCMYLVAGDSGAAGQRFGDTWRLTSDTARPYTWQQIEQPDEASGPQQKQQQQPACSCTGRSNAAAAVAGDWLLLFGGWESTGLQPLAQLEAFNLSTRTWHTSVHTSGTAPSPRGQPAAAANTAGTAVYVSGGWDGSRRFNDLHRLVLKGGPNHQQQQQQAEGWVWEEVLPQPAPPKGARAGITFAHQQALLTNQQQQQRQQGSGLGGQHQQHQQQQQQQQDVVMPCERADHVMVCWHYCDDGVWKDLLVVFGGSCSQGLLNDTWLFDVNTSSWTQAYSGGAAPCPRSSCAAAISGDVLLLHGGQTPAGVLQDMHLLNLSTLTWLQVDLGPVLQPLCRHSMVVRGSSCLLFGGYDGASAINRLLEIDLQPMQQLQRSSLQDLINSMACCGSTCGSDGSSDALAVLKGRQAVCDDGDGGMGEDAGSGSAVGGERLKAVGVVPLAVPLPVPAVVKALAKKAAPAPLKLSDLPNAAEVARMPQWKQVRQLHQAALAAGCDQYVDPKTGYTVFTAKYLQQRQCCGNKCRHCPHGWVNVAKQRLQPAAAAALPAQAADASALDW